MIYRRLAVEELYFAVANAVLGRAYDKAPFGGRGDSPFPPIDVPADGHLHLPYVDVPLEYPPPNLPFVIGPALFTHELEPYMRLFGFVMGALLLGAAMIGARIPGSDDRDERYIGFALLLLAHGAIAIQCLDAIVALLLVLVVRAAVSRRDFALGVWSGLVFAAKFLPVAVGVAALVAGGVDRRDFRRRAPSLAAGGALGVFLGLGPLVLGAPSALGTLLRYHGDRGLHVESSLGVLYGAVKALAGAREETRIDYGSFNFHGAGSLALAKASTLLVVALVLAAIYAARPSAGDRTRRIVLASLATTIALWLGGKVFSPQYVTWALPLAVAVPGREWRRVAIAFGAVLILTQVYLRGYYDLVREQHALGVITLVVRLALLGGGFAVVLRELRRPRFVR